MQELKRYERGYISSMPADKKRYFKRKFHVKSLSYGALISTGVLLSIYLDIYLMHLLVREHPLNFKTLIFCFLGLIFVVRQLRYLENIVHFGSHNNLTTGKLNDFIINVVAAIPVFQEVAKYRNFHRIHHAYFGSNNDPCKNRFSFANKYQRGIQSLSWIFVFIIQWFPKYAIDYYKSVGSNYKTTLLFIIWHLVVFFLIELSISIDFAIFLFSVFCVCVFIFLPMVRFIAEVSEHDYFSASTEYNCTFNNLSVIDKLIFHPGGDAYHLVHHLYPNVPWWMQAKAHRFLYEHDLNYKLALHRTQFLQPIATTR